MKIEEARMFEHWRRVLLILCSCFIILTIELAILGVMSQTTTNNAITTTTNHPLSPLRGGRRILVQWTWNQVIWIIQNVLGYM
jgi:hypothetical protein